MARLCDLVDQMVEVQRALGASALVARTDPTRRPEVVQMRRRFAEAVRDVSAQIDQDQQLRRDPQLADEFRHRFSVMRSRIAVFQAKWPAVLLDSSDPDFDRTAEELRASNRNFTDWAQSVLDRRA